MRLCASEKSGFLRPDSRVSIDDGLRAARMLSPEYTESFPSDLSVDLETK
jgi:hypothetical protein